MNKLLIAVLLLFLPFFSLKAQTMNSNVHSFSLNSITGTQVPLETYKGKVLLIVNVASECGYTPQYEGLQQLWEMFRDSGLVILGVPSNEFGSQEPGTNAEIQTFCSTRFGVTFPMFEKIVVKGEGIHPLYSYLTDEKQNGKHDGEVKWNFQKFLISPSGELIQVFLPKIKPMDEELIAAIRAALAVNEK